MEHEKNTFFYLVNEWYSSICHNLKNACNFVRNCPQTCSENVFDNIRKFFEGTQGNTKPFLNS